MIFNKNCVGAVDSIHFPVTVGVDEQGPFRNKNGFLSQNVLAACSFDMKFHYILAGWEGSAPEMQLLDSALTRRYNLELPESTFISAQRMNAKNLLFQEHVLYNLYNCEYMIPSGDKKMFVPLSTAQFCSRRS